MGVAELRDPSSDTGTRSNSLARPSDRVLHAIKIGGTGDGRMPPQLLTGESADEVASYVSKVAGQ